MTRRPVRFSLVLAAAVVVVGSSGGCYHRVVGAKGVGASGVEVYEPNVPGQRPDRTRASIRDRKSTYLDQR